MNIDSDRKLTETQPPIGPRSISRSETSQPTVGQNLGERFRDVLLARDLEAMYAILAPDVALYSPVLTWGAFKFAGRDETIQAIRVFMNSSHDLEFTLLAPTEESCVLAFNMRMGNDSMDGMFLVEVGSQKLISGVKVFIRGYLPVAVFTSRFGPGLSRYHSLWRSILSFIATRATVQYIRFLNYVAVNVIVTPSLRALRDRALTLPVKPR